MSIFCSGKAIIKHKRTNKIYEIDAEDVHWECVDEHERRMGSEKQHEGKIDHPDLGEISWTIWEYPKGAESSSEVDSNGHEIIRDINYGLSQTSDD